jgi:hypothetical protein
VVAQVVAKTDGVPLFVEELTKMLLESGLLQEREARYELTGPLPPLAIPTTLHDSLMARLDRLATVKGLAQLGATLGREFSYALLHAVSPWDEGTLGRGLHQLVEAEFLYQQGLPPQATYRFKHALIQETAYQSLLRSTRQQYHQRIAQVLEARFPWICETQPELVAQHYTAAGCAEQAVRCWQRAGEHASNRSAHLEAVSHFTAGIELLTTLPETPAHTQHALTLHIALGAPCRSPKGRQPPRWSIPIPRHARCVSRWARRQRWSRSYLGCGGFIWYEHSCTRRASSAKPCCAWRNRQATRRSRSSPIMPSGQRGCGWAHCLLLVCTRRRPSPATRQISAVCWRSAWATIRVLAAAFKPL